MPSTVSSLPPEPLLQPPAQPGSAAQKLSQFVVPALFLLVGSWLAARHILFEEWDGCIQAFAAKEMAQGLGYTGWASHYWPPLFSVLLLLLSKWMSYFVAGKAISVVSGTLLVAIMYPLALEVSRSRRVALATQLLLATNQLFLNTSIQIENHTLATLLFALTVLLALVAVRRQSLSWVLAWGACAGLAGLTRYTNMVLAPAGVLLILLLIGGRRRFGYALVFLAAFIAVGSPWYAFNYHVNGAPLATWLYHNVGKEVIPKAWHSTPAKFWWSDQAHFHSLRDIILANPRVYLRNFLSQLRMTVTLIITLTGLLGVVGFVGALALPRLTERRCWLTLWVCAAAYVALTCQAFVYGVVMMPFLPFIALTAAMLLAHLARWYRRQRPKAPATAIASVIFALLLAMNLQASYRNLTTYLSDRSDEGEMVAAEAVGSALNRDPLIGQKYVMATNPARAYYAGSRFMCLPLYFTSDDPTALVTYRGLPTEVLNWAPRYPFRPMVNRADYLIYDEAARRFLPQYAYLMDAKSKRVPENWSPVYAAPDVVVWRIRW